MKIALIVLIGLIFFGCKDRTTDNNISTENREDYSKLRLPILSVVDEFYLPHRTVQTSSIKDIFALFKSIGYDDKKWYEYKQVIPRVYLKRISCRWRGQSSKMDVNVKKDIFFKLITPAILRSNELIQIERNYLLAIAKNPRSIDEKTKKWLIKTAKKYRVIKNEKELVLSESFIQKLLMRVDTIAPSLALAQAAQESGWATSRFASEGNALFGQWTTSKKAMIPNRQREKFSNFGLARFKTPQDSVNSYMLNLNTHKAYKKLREKRYKLREEGKKVTGLELSETLDKYSERGYAYVKELKKMIEYNHLAHFDTAHLWAKEVIFIYPKRIKRKTPTDVNQSDENITK